MTDRKHRWGAIGAAVMVVALLAAAASAGADTEATTRGIDADTVDGHHAASSSAPMAERRNRVLWADSKGTLNKVSMPSKWLHRTYLNADRAEAIQATSTGAILAVTNLGNGFALRATGGGDADGNDALGDLLLGGTRGEVFAEGNYLNMYSNWNINVLLDDDDDDYMGSAILGSFNIFDGKSAIVFSVDESGDMTASGTKSAVVETESYGERLLYAVESPEVWFEDFGSGSLVDGVAVVTFEAIFAETIDLDGGYHVFVTPLGDCNGLYVAAKTASGFEVRELGGGTADVGFDYRIVAKRAGYEGVRLEAPGS